MPWYFKFLIFIIGFAVGASLVLIPYIDKINSIQKKAQVKINDQYIVAEVVKDQASLEKGLAGRKDIGINEGMLFVFSKEGNYGFWMKGMLIPIDLIWISKNKIVGFEENMMPPQKDENDSNLKIYYPPTLVDKVLELRAGRVELLHAKVGDDVYMKFIVPQAQVSQDL